MQLRSMPASTGTMVEPERRNKKEIERRAESENGFVNITVKRGREARGRTTNTIGRETGEIDGGTRSGTCGHSATTQCSKCHAGLGLCCVIYATDIGTNVARRLAMRLLPAQVACIEPETKLLLVSTLGLTIYAVEMCKV